MMNKIAFLVLLSFQLLLTACSPVKRELTNAYKLESYSYLRLDNGLPKQSILVTMPEAAAGFQDSDMLYVNKPFALRSFAKNAWVDQPAYMLLPLIAQSLQSTGYFYAVTSTVNSELTNYRLDTQLIRLQQNFLTRPSKIEFAAKVVLTHVSDNRVIASRIISEQINCPSDTPYGGVIAANRATKLFTAEVSRFVVSQVRKDSGKCITK